MNMVYKSLQIFLATDVGKCIRLASSEVFGLLKLHKLLPLTLSGWLLAAACSASLRDPAPSDTNGQLASERVGNAVSDTNLPISERFRTLDEYLQYIEMTQAPVDGPWYKQVGPDAYELQTGNLKLDVPAGEAEKRVFTRQELERKFGFTK